MLVSAGVSGAFAFPVQAGERCRVGASKWDRRMAQRKEEEARWVPARGRRPLPHPDDAALDPVRYLGSAGEFVDRTLKRYREGEN